jgi:hypothetical protein
MSAHQPQASRQAAENGQGSLSTNELLASRITTLFHEDLANVDTERLAVLAATLDEEDPGNVAQLESSEEDSGNVAHLESSEEASTATWAPVELSEALWNQEAPHATLLTRTDDVSLLYPGLIHSLHGESESGKSLIVQAEAARVLGAGGSVLYIDFESDAGSLLGRLQRLGVDPAAVKRLHYVRPDVAPDSILERPSWERLLNTKYTLVIIDGVTDALSMCGYTSNDNDHIARFIRQIPRKLADRTGAAVVLVDHVTKDRGTRGRFAVGGQAKMAGLTGAAYLVEPVEPLAVGRRGVVVLRIGKDRPGTLRLVCGSYRNSDRTQEAARVIVDSRTEKTIVSIEPPSLNSLGSDTFRPTAIMETISRLLEASSSDLTRNNITNLVSSKKPVVVNALNLLVEEEFVAVTPGRNRSQLHSTIKAYRQKYDPQSDTYEGTDPLVGS